MDLFAELGVGGVDGSASRAKEEVRPATARRAEKAPSDSQGDPLPFAVSQGASRGISLEQVQVRTKDGPADMVVGHVDGIGLFVGRAVRLIGPFLASYRGAQGQMTMSDPNAPWADQRTPALAIVARGDQIQPVNGTEYDVRSQSDPDRFYKVRYENGKWSCECLHHRNIGRKCIHILAVKLRADLQAAVSPQAATQETCPKCKGGQVVKNAVRKNKSGIVQTWLCRECDARFTGQHGFQRRRSEPRMIAMAIDLYFRGLSLRKVAEHLTDAHGLGVSHMTVRRWIEHYSALAATWLDKQNATVGDRWHVDETVVKVRSTKTKGGKRNQAKADGKKHAATYLYNVMDADTRYLLATHISTSRDLRNTRKPFQKAKKATSDRPREVFSDGMQAYPGAVSKEFGKTGGKNGWDSPHRRVPSIRAAESNNVIERLHGTQKERLKVMRGLDGTKGAGVLAEGLRAHYNAVRTHSALGMTPAEAAGILLPSAEKKGRWQRSIEAAAEDSEAAKGH